MYESSLLHVLLFLWLVRDFALAQSVDLPRWGQAASLVQNTLYIHGGRTDQYGAYAYSSAPVTNDLLTLDLTQPFSTSSVPWQYISGCGSCSANQGPAVSWHTLSAFNTSSLLLFGGDPGPNSPIVLPEKPDSAVLLQLGGGQSQGQSPAWDFPQASWADEPLRRIYHTTSFSRGKVYLVGGLKADGSGAAFAQHYAFDPTVPSFTQLSSTGAPADILGHCSVLLSNGSILIFGGYSPSQQLMTPMTTVWSLDTTQATPLWSTVAVSGASVPPTRRGFACTSLPDQRIIMHGGADSVLQNSLSDGWILDTTQNPMVWTSVPALSQLGPRRDHTAVAIGSSVLFAFGYATNGPASPSVSVFDVSSSSFQPNFTPPPAGSVPPATTLPGASPTSGAGSPGGSGSGSGGGGSGSGGSNPNSPGSGSDNGSGGGGGGPNSGNSSDGHSHAAAIALGTIFGIVGLMVGTFAAAYYARRRRRGQESFHLLSPNTDEEDSPHLGRMIPVAGGVAMTEKGLPLPPAVKSVKDRLTGIVPGRTVRNLPERRDMLADEDRDFEWGAIRRDPSSARSSVKRPSIGDKVYDSLASLRTVGGAMLDYAAGTAVMRTIRNEGSTGSRWTKSEKEASDPFGDDWGLVKARRPSGGRQGSSYSYADPFEDYEVQSVKFDYNAPAYTDKEDEKKGYLRLSDPPPRPYLHSALPPAVDLTRHTPVSERPSLSTLTESGNTPSDSSHSNSNLSLSTPFGTALSTSTSSHDTPRSPTHRPSSLIDANSPSQATSSTMRRSNSWWVRFAKTPLLDRRSSDASRNTQPLDFRDPNPPPSSRLVPIEEAASIVSPTNSKRGSNGSGGESEGGRGPSSGGHHQLWSSQAHGRSASSLQTSRTADSEALERMGQMDIVQRGLSHGTEHSSSGGDPGQPNTKLQRPLSVITTSTASSSLMTEDDPALLVMSPDTLVDPKPQENPGQRSPPRKRSPTGAVAERIQAFERRMSQQEETLKSPPPIRSRNRGNSTYGIAPKAPLFVTNPDKERSGSGDS